VTKPVRTEPEAGEELLEAARWYESRRRGLGMEFLAAIGAAVELIQQHPNGGSPVPGVKDEVPARRLVLRRFPYSWPLHITADAQATGASGYDKTLRLRPRWNRRAGTWVSLSSVISSPAALACESRPCSTPGRPCAPDYGTRHE
jgi:hypothetical protein